MEPGEQEGEWKMRRERQTCTESCRILQGPVRSLDFILCAVKVCWRIKKIIVAAVRRMTAGAKVGTGKQFGLLQVSPGALN